jgi:DNA-binding response OmpR family regulator
MCSTTWRPSLTERVDLPRVLVLADDLIWSDRLARAVAAAEAEPVRVTTAREFDDALADAGYAVVDLTARAYDGLAAIERAATAGVTVLGVGQHDDHDLRRRALAAGADRVLAYRKLAEDGPAVIAAFLARGAASRA